jgi:hypothetical protein
MSTKVQKNGLLPLENSTIKLEKVPESALILEKGLFILKQSLPRFGGVFYWTQKDGSSSLIYKRERILISSPESLPDAQSAENSTLWTHLLLQE